MAATLKQREELASMLPWIAREPTASEQCMAIKSSAPLKAYWDRKTGRAVSQDDPERLKHQCKFAARWVYVDPYGNVSLYCWHHLMYRGFLYSEGEERYHQWQTTHQHIIDLVLGKT